MFGLFPLVFTAWISLHSYRLGSDMSYTGLENYRWLFTSPEFYNALFKTFTIGVIGTVPQLLIAIGIAQLLNYRLRGRSFFRVIMIMPYATSVAASTPTSESTQLAKPASRPKIWANTSVAAATDVAYGMIMMTRKTLRPRSR